MKTEELWKFKKYFWDIDFKSLDIGRHRRYIIERLLEFGDEKAASWLRKKVSKKAIVETLRSNRKISPKSAEYWRRIYGVNCNSRSCHNNQARTIRNHAGFM